MVKYENPLLTTLKAQALLYKDLLQRPFSHEKDVRIYISSSKIVNRLAHQVELLCTREREREREGI
jgi:hypothetical protein